jgi:hypothetical protein
MLQSIATFSGFLLFQDASANRIFSNDVSSVNGGDGERCSIIL